MLADGCKGSCPVVCLSDQMKCSGGVDSSGCPMHEYCKTNTYGNDGTVCPSSCEVFCTEDQMKCDGGKDANGCQKPNTCVGSQGRKFYDYMINTL